MLVVFSMSFRMAAHGLVNVDFVIRLFPSFVAFKFSNVQKKRFGKRSEEYCKINGLGDTFFFVWKRDKNEKLHEFARIVQKFT